MENLIEAIRAATAEGATAEAKQSGIDACRAILAALETPPGQPLAPPSPAPVPAHPLAGLQPDQVLDLVIAKLRSMVPADKPQATPARAELRIPIINLPK